MRRVAVAMSTTGPEPKKGHRITELAAIEINGDATGETLYLRIMQDAAAATAKAEVTYSEALTQWTEFVAGSPMVVHDYYEFKRFLRADCKRASVGFDIARDYPVVDTWVLASERFPRQRHGLLAVIRKLGLESNVTALDALEAARMVARIADKLSAVDEANLTLPPIAVKMNLTSVQLAMAKAKPTKTEPQESPIPQRRDGLIAQLARFWRELTRRA